MTIEKVEKIIAKIRKLYSHVPVICDCVSDTTDVYVRFKEKSHKLELESIEMGMYDKVIIIANKAVLVPEHGKNTVLLEYKNWDELLNY